MVFGLTYKRIFISSSLPPHPDDQPDTHSDLVSPSLPLKELQGDSGEYIFLLMECLRATIEGMYIYRINMNSTNGREYLLVFVRHAPPYSLIYFGVLCLSFLSLKVHTYIHTYIYIHTINFAC